MPYGFSNDFELSNHAVLNKITLLKSIFVNTFEVFIDSIDGIQYVLEINALITLHRSPEGHLIFVLEYKD